MMATFLDLLGKPRGPLAPFLLGMMNLGHKPLIRSVLSEIHIEPFWTVLDVGCGGGNAVAVLADAAHKVYGVDISAASVKRAAARNRRHVDSSRVSILQADVASLPFDDGTFDLVTAFETIYFWEDLDACFNSVRRKLKPGGTFLVACEAVKEGKTSSYEKLSKGKMRVYGREEIRTAFERAGFDFVSEFCRSKPRWLCVGGRLTIPGEILPLDFSRR